MIYKASMLYNPKDVGVEWRVDGKCYFLGPKEAATFDGDVVKQALKYTNTGLEIYDPKNVTEVKPSGYDKLPWRELVSIASKEGVFQPGMQKKAVIEALEKHGQSQRTI